MTTINRRHNLLVALVYTLGSFSLPVACTGPSARSSAKPKLPAAEYHVNEAPGSTYIDSQHYADLLSRVESDRISLASRYHHAASDAERKRIMAEVRETVIRAIYTEIFPNWYGTGWDFNGTTEVPQQGKIACGYFVTTVLRDAGWRVQRARLAQQASENIILSLTGEPYIKRFRHVAIGDFVKAMEEWGSGIYVVGLDIHTGFIVNSGDEVYFVHSSYAEPFAVVKEKAVDSKILQASQYRVLGKITADEDLLEKWLLKKEIVTRLAV